MLCHALRLPVKFYEQNLQKWRLSQVTKIRSKDPRKEHETLQKGLKQHLKALLKGLGDGLRLEVKFFRGSRSWNKFKINE